MYLSDVATIEQQWQANYPRALHERKPRSSGRHRGGNWADIEDVDDLQSSGPSLSQLVQSGNNSDSNIPSSNASECSTLGSQGSKAKGIKLRNKALTKEQLAVMDTSSGSQTISGGAARNQFHSSSLSDSASSALQSSDLESSVDGPGAQGPGDARELAQQEGLAAGDHPSVGSIRHELGACKPCLFVRTHVGCQNGMNCTFCHYLHKSKSKPRPCKGKRDRYRKLLIRMEQNAEGKAQVEDDDGPDEGEDDDDNVSEKAASGNRIVMGL
jgi:hypothetical protein